MIKHDSVLTSLNFPASNSTVIRFATRNDVKSLHRQRHGRSKNPPEPQRSNCWGRQKSFETQSKAHDEIQSRVEDRLRRDIRNAVDNCFVRSHIRRGGH